MKKILFILFLSTLLANAQTIENSNWNGQTLNLVSATNMRSTEKINDIYLEAEFMGRQGALDYYGYVDLPKVLGVASKGYKGIWDRGSIAFIEVSPRLSINHLSKKGSSKGFIKEVYLASNFTANLGEKSKYTAAQSLWLGASADFNIYSKLSLSGGIYTRRTFSNYGAPNEESWKGWRIKANWYYPITNMFKDKAVLSFGGYANYDFGLGMSSDNAENIYSNNALEVSNSLDLSFKHFRIATVGNYYNHAGALKYNGGSSLVNSSGWAHYLYVGYKF